MSVYHMKILAQYFSSCTSNFQQACLNYQLDNQDKIKFYYQKRYCTVDIVMYYVDVVGMHSNYACFHVCSVPLCPLEALYNID